MTALSIDEQVTNQQYLISRYDHYYDSVNNKGTFLITFQSFLIGAVVLGNTSILTYISDTNWKFICGYLLIALVGCCLWSAYYLLKSLSPYTDSGNEIPASYKSLIAFDSLNNISNPVEYRRRFNNQSKEEYLVDLTYQVQILATGLSHKFKFLKRSIFPIYLEGIITIMILIIIICF